ncbi:jg14130 [Pararge aegeria aegeria]|uniref:Jg14130 protein n=1 Tax=Pararge aegeria aegeria TaxID=348720 RepID=A0A8S4RZM7_9NEOP|nr:jg14130 [Pararge aegeria aegeria]
MCPLRTFRSETGAYPGDYDFTMNNLSIIHCKVIINDHGGPLVAGHGKSSVVIGVISACMTANITQKCYGPFLYTSVWRNRHVISCAIEKDIGHSGCDAVGFVVGEAVEVDAVVAVGVAEGVAVGVDMVVAVEVAVREAVEVDAVVGVAVADGVAVYYVFDGHENDNIRWMNNDIAVVKVEDGFEFNRKIKGCDFVPKPISYNNQSQTLENPGALVTIAGWGTTSRYNDGVSRRKGNGQNLLESHVEIIPKNKCKRRWGSRYHNIIDNYMICTKDIGQTMSEICNEKYVDCQDINYSEEEDARRDGKVLRSELIPTNLTIHSAHNDTRRYTSQTNGGFCENDHGGPLVYGTGINSIVIGVISACLVKESTNKCYGPFLYTSVYKNRQFISCAINKDVEPKCRRQFRSGVTHVEKVMSWKDHSDG